MTKIDANQLKWIRKPERYIVRRDSVILETEPYTDLRGHRHGAEAVELSLKPDGYFMFTVRVDFSYQGKFDQCGILLYNGSRRKAVCCTKRRNEELDELDVVVFHGKYGDRSCREIGTAIRWMYYRVWYRAGAVRIQYSFNGRVYSDVRQFRMEERNGPIRIGIYACSPQDSRFDCTFSQMELKEKR